MKHNWEYKRLGEICDILDSQRRPVTKSDRKPGPYPYYGASGVQDYVSDYIFDGDYLLVGEDGAKWGANEKSAFSISGKTWVNNHAHILDFKKSPVSQKFVEYILCGSDLNKIITGTVVPKLTQKNLISVLIPVPPREVQEQIVAELDKINEVIEDSRELLRNLDALAQSLFYDIFGDPITNPKGWEMETLGTVSTVVGGSTPKTSNEEYWGGNLCWITPAELKGDKNIYDTDRHLTELGVKSCTLQLLPINTVLLTSRAPIGKVAIAKTPMYCNQGFKNIICNPQRIHYQYMYSYLSLIKELLNEKGSGATFKEISKRVTETIPIPAPHIALQEQFAERIEAIEAEKKHVEATIAELQTLLASRMDYWFN